MGIETELRPEGEITDQPPAYAIATSPRKSNEAVTFSGLSNEEEEWVGTLAKHKGKPRCFNCRTGNAFKCRESSGLRQIIRPRDWISLNGIVTIHRSNFSTFLSLLPQDPVKAGTKLREAILVYNNLRFFSHDVRFGTHEKRMLLKVTSCRGLGPISIEDLHKYLPVCIHCHDSRVLAKQLITALNDWILRGKRKAGSVYRCSVCPTEYATMIVPRVPCHLYDTKASACSSSYLRDFTSLHPDKFDPRPEWSKYMMLAFCQWIDLGPTTSTLEMVEERLDTAGDRTERINSGRLPQPVALYNDTADAICTLFEGEKIWPYSSALPQRLLISRNSVDLDDLPSLDAERALSPQSS